MALVDFLNHTCTIQRGESANRNIYGGYDPSLTNVATGVSCRLYTKAERVVDDIQSKGAIITRFKLTVAASVDIQEGDTITSVTPPGGSADTTQYTVEAVMPRYDKTSQRFTVCELKKVG